MILDILNNRQQLIQKSVDIIIDRILHSPNNQFVLGLSTGATVLSICEALANKVQQDNISLKNVTIFYAGEFVGFSQNIRQYYFDLLHKNFFCKVDILVENIHMLNGNAKDLEQECQNYEQKIQNSGGIDLFIGSLGVGGELAFNESGSSLVSRTRLKTLTSETLKADARFFDNDISKVPTQAITIGIDTIMDAREILIVVYGVHKAFAVKSCIEGAVSEMSPASILQIHPNVTFMVDQVAGRLLVNPI